MKINVRHEPATKPDEGTAEMGAVATPDRTCVWIVGDDNETLQTEYLDAGQKTEIDVSTSTSIAATAPQPI